MLPPTTDSNNGKKLRVLVADDNPINLRIAVRVLREMGHGGVVVGDGEQALNALASQVFDLVLLDVTMPVRDGISTLAEIRQRELRGTRHTPVIMVTAHDLPGDRERFVQLGANGYVPKPLERTALQAEIQRLLR